jgi:hypothetical protein
VPTPRHSRSISQHAWLLEHWPFVTALVLGAVVRVVVQIAFSPAFVYGDGPRYLDFLDTLVPYADRPDGYSLLLLYPLSKLTPNVVLSAALLQHVIGLATATLLYLTLRRWGVGRWPATLAALPILFDTMQLVLEQSLLSDTLFGLLLMVVVALLGWRRRPSRELALAAGLVLGTAVTVRVVGEPMIVTALAFCLFVGHSWWGRLVPAAALLVGFAVPVGAYAVWYHQHHGVYALSEYSGEALWLRTTTFVDCSRISVPQYQRVLCPTQPLGQRLDPTYYGFHDPLTLARLKPPPGTTIYQAMGEFAKAAIRAQPLDYLRVVLRDFVLNFDVTRSDRYEYDTAYKWQFSGYVHFVETQRIKTSYSEHAGEQLHVRQPFANMLVVYQLFAYVPGPLLLGCLVLGLLGGLGVGRPRTSARRPMCLLLTATGTVLLLVPDATAEFVWRYQLPALLLLPAGAALAYTAIRGQDEGGTVATASTD